MFVAPTDPPKEVYWVIKSLKNARLAGWDGVPAKVIKAADHQICKLLSCLIVYSFERGTFPEKLKFSDIKPD